MLTRKRPDFRTVDRWAIGLLLEAGAIHKWDEHGWARDRTARHARDEVVRIAREAPLAGLSSDEAVAAVREVLDSVGDTCPECKRWNPNLPDQLIRVWCSGVPRWRRGRTGRAFCGCRW